MGFEGSFLGAFGAGRLHFHLCCTDEPLPDKWPQRQIRQPNPKLEALQYGAMLVRAKTPPRSQGGHQRSRSPPLTEAAA